ncbi:MAG TPA: DUF6335 family protein [Acidobacteriota bacterium]|nr:DUF6335 family protein [Acidobacteriota bacterium]
MAKKEDRKDPAVVIHESSSAPLDEEIMDDFTDEQKKEYSSRRWAQELKKHTSKSPKLSGGDVDANWQQADTGEEVVGGDNPTPDQDIVEELGEALGVTYQDTEPLRGSEKIQERDEERWELDPASSEDYPERNKRKP